MTDAFSPDDADRLLGGLAGDSPLGAALDGLRTLAQTATPEMNLVVSQMTAAAAGGAGWLGYAWLFRPRGLLLAKLVTAAAATSTAVTGGVAVAGNLPAPIQRVVADAAERVGINIPGGRGEPSASPPTIAPVPTSTSSTSTSSTSTTSTTSTSTSTTTTSTTTGPVTATTDQGPGHCVQLDAAIVDGSATLAPAPNNAKTLSLLAHTTGMVDDVSAIIGGLGSTPLRQTSPGTWTATLEVQASRQPGERITFTAIGCGFDDLDVDMQQSAP